MDAADALAAVPAMSPKLVIPCHYNVSFVFSKKMAPANVQAFSEEVEGLAIECRVMQAGDELVL
jgi:L-ascorbate metabolism protein UlaG (beta-lactamase superfamily)